MSFLCPNQLRAFGLSVCDTPQQFDADSPHDISFPDSKLRIPLKMEGVVSYFPSRGPTNDEIANCTRLEMTSDAAWDPRSQHFRQTETQLCERGVDSNVFMVSTLTQLSGTGMREILNEVMSSMTPMEILAVASADDGLLAKRLEEMVNVSGGDLRGDGICMIGLEHELCAVVTSLPHPVTTKEILAKRWGLGLETTKRTMEVTTQVGTRLESMFIWWCGGSRHNSRRSDIQGCRGSSTQTQFFLQRFRCMDIPVPKSSPMGTGTTNFTR